MELTPLSMDLSSEDRVTVAFAVVFLMFLSFVLYMAIVVHMHPHIGKVQYA